MKERTDRSRRLLAVIGNASRWRVVAALAGGGQCVTELASRIDLSQSCTTRHLQALVREGVVRGQRDGKRVVFALRLEDPKVRELLTWALPGLGREPQQSTAGAERIRGRRVVAVEKVAEEARSAGGRSAIREGGKSGAEREARADETPGAPPPPANLEHPDERDDDHEAPRRDVRQDDMEDWLL